MTTEQPHRGRPSRADSLPEFARYTDDGCSVAPHCLECPLPRCRYDQPGGARYFTNLVRDAEIVRLSTVDHVDVDRIADRMRLSRRTIFRVLNAERARRA